MRFFKIYYSFIPLKIVLIVGAIFINNSLQAQRENHLVYPEVDSLYREDQFYVSATFHLIGQRPNGVEQSGFSGGLHAGFIRDFPINKKRNWAIGLGAGYSINVYNHNLFLSEVNGQTQFRILTAEDDKDINRFRNQIVEVPLQIRWRTSTPESYKFWRVYTGFRFGYMHSFSYQFENTNGTQKTTLRNIDGLNRFRAGATLTFGFNTFNFHVYYALNPFFNNSTSITDSQGGFSAIKIGLIFYIL